MPSSAINMSFFKRKLKSKAHESGHSRNSSVSSVSSLPVEKCPTPQQKSAASSPDIQASFISSLQKEENRWQEVTDAEKEHLIGQRLTKTLRCLAADKCALGYLTAFLESRHAAGYLHFWMEAEAIRRQLEGDELGPHDRDSSHPAEGVSGHGGGPERGATGEPAPAAPDPRSLPVSDPCDSRGVPDPGCARPRNGERSGAALARLVHKYVLSEAGAQLRLPPELRAAAERLGVTGAARQEKGPGAGGAGRPERGADGAARTEKGPGADGAGRTERGAERLERGPGAGGAGRTEKGAGADGAGRPERGAGPERREGGRSVEAELAARLQAAADAALTAGHLAEFLQSDHYQCYQVDVLTSSAVEICDILFNETVVFMFMEFMEQEGLAHYIEFWMSSNNFRDQLYAMGDSCDSQQTQNDAMILYDKYFSLQAASPLGFGHLTRTELELNICRDGGPEPECFLRPMLVLHNVLQQRYLAEFINSQTFFKYAMDLVNTIRHPAKPYPFDRTDAVSTCSSDLASSVTGGSVPERWSHSDPGKLHRRRYYGLSIGHVNHVGRYESHLEPKPDPGRPSALRRAVQTVLRHDDNKVKEEMAWRVANLIVRDVTNVTLGLGGSPTHRPHSGAAGATTEW